ncbi:A24 family peptidase [Fibrobacter succinogenes]|uniref:prepilin peptidase n=1 Tax=Fibrobacter succinogenes TaxID=833 RepID=UPI0015680271|nr:A24 family peptidase [Fibrobacter succinogenes]
MQEIPLWYWLIVFFCLGACVGSFYNVIVYRMPRGISLINPPSHCPLCKKRIPIRYNLPIVGWLWLRGKSACCKQPISVIYPIGESLCGLLGALALYAAVGFGTDFSRPVLSPEVWADAAAMFWLLLGAYPVCAVDCKYKLIPDSISVGGIVAGLLISLVPGGVTPLQSLIGAVVAGGGLYLLGWIATKVLKKDAMGFGDVKLLAGYGALMGVTGAVETLLVAALLGILVMVPYGVLAAKKSAQNKNSEDAGQIPFGPFLAIAAPVIYLWGAALVEVYFKYVLE